MVKVILGVKGSGNTKELMKRINEAVAAENGSLVCIEKGSDLTYDVDYRVRLIDAGDYGMEGYTFLRGFLAGLHGGNYDISHIFIDNLCKVCGVKSCDGMEEFLAWCDTFGEKNNVSFTIAVSGDPDMAPEWIGRYI